MNRGQLEAHECDKYDETTAEGLALVEELVDRMGADAWWVFAGGGAVQVFTRDDLARMLVLAVMRGEGMDE